MYYTVVKHDGHLRTRGKCRKHEPQFLKTFVAWNVSSLCSAEFLCAVRPAPSLCFHSFSGCDWFVASSHDLMRISNLIAKEQYIFLFLTNVFHSYFIKAIDHSFYGFTGVIDHLGCWENTRKACKSLAYGSWFTSFSRVLPTSQVVYYAGKPIERVVYCLNKTWVFDWSERAQGPINLL